MVWDGAPSHRSALVQALDFPLVQQPAYAPDLNPVERLFEELRRAVEGRVHTTVDEKVAAIEAELRKWDANLRWVRRLPSWSRIRDTIARLPRPDPSTT